MCRAVVTTFAAFLELVVKLWPVYPGFVGITFEDGYLKYRNYFLFYVHMVGRLVLINCIKTFKSKLPRVRGNTFSLSFFSLKMSPER